MRKLVLFLVTFVLWLLLTHTLRLQFVITGAVISLLTALLFGNIFVKNSIKFFQIARYFWFFWYLIFFIWECVKANLDVAYRVLHPSLPIRPGIVKARINLRTEIARTILANSITMTPGTLSVDIVGEHIFVHWIYVRDELSEASRQRIVGRFETILARIFE
ncbi:MAG: Na+/H+ antiporter subunit E [Phycisphaerales bacterium]|nr:MAG: Na+/H+ antiporter subunit E [Phycisphaerales bacterium]